MTFCADDKTPKARKDHRCCACGEKIPVGFTYVKSFYADGGTARSDKWHQECRDEFGRMLKENCDHEGDPLDTWENGLPDDIKIKYSIPLNQCEHGVLHEHPTEYCPKCLHEAMRPDSGN